MNRAMIEKYLRRAALVFAAFALTAGVASAATFNLRAEATTLTMPDGASVPAWGFADDTAGTGTVTVPGPRLTVPPGDTTLTINLTNNLPEAVSLVIPGQPAALAPATVTDGLGRTRVKSFTTETAAGAMGVYTWTGLKPGTYLYQSGTNPGKQVPMGLYGAVTADAAAGQAYTGVSYAAEVVLFYSEIDTAINAVSAAAKPLSYTPEYYLVNGQPFNAAAPVSLAAGIAYQPTLLRLLNAGLKTHVPTLQGGYWKVVAEDGNLYPYAREQYSAMLAAGKTLDVLWTPAAPGEYMIYDRSLHLTSAGAYDGGLRAKLGVAPALARDASFTYTPNLGFFGVDTFTYHAANAGGPSASVTVTITVNDPPVTVADAYAVAEDGILTVVAPGVLGNDTDANAGDLLMAMLVAGPTSGVLTFSADGSFSYRPNANFNGTDSFAYKANDGKADGNTAAVTITVTPVNDAPLAADDTANTPRNVAVFVNLVQNDYDPDDPAGVFGNMPGSTINRNSITIVTQPTRGGTLVVLTDGVNYTPKRNFRGTDVFTYRIRDTAGALSNTATARVNVR
ncbi:MAG: tandem-95 repeat protein [Planctomycetes bacterium]|nr:tandem-95 repeat protein [Planctomycetota bacterium]